MARFPSSTKNLPAEFPEERSKTLSEPPAFSAGNVRIGA